MDRSTAAFSMGSSVHQSANIHDGDYGRWALQPREVKFEDSQLGLVDGGRCSEVSGKVEGRRWFKPPPKLHTHHQRHSKAASEINIDEVVRASSKQESFKRQGLSIGISSNSPENSTAVGLQGKFQVSRRVARIMDDAVSSDVRQIHGRPRQGKKIASGGSFAFDGRQQELLVEGNSVLSHDFAYTAQALAHLSDCVSLERRLREELEVARFAKLQAFRAITKIFMTSFLDSGTVNPSAPLRCAPDTISLARCSVVTNTLVATIQTYVRCVASTCLVRTLNGHAGYALKRETLDSAGVLTLTLSSECSMPRDVEQSFATTRSLEDILDMQEINQLKQLYFDYFDCEVMRIETPSPNNGSDTFPTTHPLQSMTDSDHGSVLSNSSFSAM